MLAIEIELLTGCYRAGRHDDRRRAEWPPHPTRLFSALVAAWATALEPREEEREALLWLEAQPAPDLVASGASERTPGTHYVPVNDVAAVRDYSQTYLRLTEAAAVTAGGTPPAPERLEGERVRAAANSTAWAEQSGIAEGSIAILAEERVRQPRNYPTVRPDDPRVYLRWPDSEPDEALRTHIDALTRRVSRLGHSSSLVACRVVEGHVPPATHVPADHGDILLRVPVPGQLDALERAHARHQGSQPRVTPAVTRPYRLTSGVVPVPTPVTPLLGGEWFVLEQVHGPRVPLPATLAVARAIRGALLAHAEDPPPELLSGHSPGQPGEQTGPTTEPHLAVVPLPAVGRRHLDGHATGVALVLPSSVTVVDRSAMVAALGRWRDPASQQFVVNTGATGPRTYRLADPVDTPNTLTRTRWCRPSRRWASVTPVALDRFPGDLSSRDAGRAGRAAAAAADILSVACERAGLPRPLDVQVSRSPLVTGSRPVASFPAFRSRAQVTRASVHAEVVFAAPVSGPLLLGAGRFLGRGLFLPLDSLPLDSLPLDSLPLDEANRG